MGGICHAGRTPLKIVVSTVNAVYYRDYILLPISPPVIRRGHIYTYQQENARCHMTRICTLLERHLIVVLLWPALSPKLSPIELRRHVCQRQNPPKALEQLRRNCLRGVITFHKPLLGHSYIQRVVDEKNPFTSEVMY